ncbi:MAG: hypothetical protein QXF97_07240 [Candidatus Caldarchaeum sp.]
MLAQIVLERNKTSTRGFFGEGPHGNKPWLGICCERCWLAAEERCVCRCGGVNHGRGLGQAKLDDFGEPVAIDFPAKGLRCVVCGEDLDSVQWHGYEHADGVWVDGRRMWLFKTCTACGYQNSFAKLLRGSRL